VSRSPYSQWYTDRKWRKKRAAHLAKEPLCRMCKKQGKVTAAQVVDHIEPHKGDRQKFWFGEVQSLCHPCHSGTKARMEHGKTVVGDDGWSMEGSA
jgi:5-methylcytosine-specific restriction protein A